MAGMLSKRLYPDGFRDAPAERNMRPDVAGVIRPPYEHPVSLEALVFRRKYPLLDFDLVQANCL